MSAAARPLVVGIDLGGTKVRAGVAAMDGALLHEVVEATRRGPGLLAQLAELIGRMERTAGGRVVATAIGGAGVPDDDQGSFSLAPNLSGLDGVGLVGELETRLGHRVVIENDVNIAALGELSDGVGRSEPSFAFVAVGTGIGVGLVLDGRLWSGAAGGAGEVGYLPIGADPLDPANHRRGALEERLAGDALARRYAEAAGETGPVSAHEVFDRAAAGDPAAVSALDEEARWLAYALVSLEAVVDPGLFVLGGGIGGRVELLAPLRAWLVRLGRASVRVRLSTLGPSAPVLGAIRLAIDTATRTEREAS
ncbi:ROK family protein [Leifsonia sp. ZF2019]|uniref:ROK family protein n=1 Tax=Leifsonia sp. ZF2019 TaxID=2781978 RepID=UPI001CBC7BBE|nr:ROK family protein [Leifsonia sp. ZF2019]UAJ78407.1 ROK family protein [Leifsonia sp. ZF2019]